MSLERQLNRFLRTKAGEKHPKVLDAFNNQETMRNQYRHATKGYRTFSIKRGKAALITAEMKKGMFPPAIISWRKIKQLLTSDLSA